MNTFLHLVGLIDRLERLSRLHCVVKITDEEFSILKAKLIKDETEPASQSDSETTERIPPKDELARKILEWPIKNPIAAVIAVVAIFIATFVLDGPAGGIETCNDAGVLQTLQKGLMEKIGGVINLLANTQEFKAPSNAKALDQMKSISANVSNIVQISLDKDNKIRTCEGSVSYKNYSEAYTPMLMALGASICRGRVRYKITRPLDSPKDYYINWVCE